MKGINKPQEVYGSEHNPILMESLEGLFETGDEGLKSERLQEFMIDVLSAFSHETEIKKAIKDLASDVLKTEAPKMVSDEISVYLRKVQSACKPHRSHLFFEIEAEENLNLFKNVLSQYPDLAELMAPSDGHTL